MKTNQDQSNAMKQFIEMEAHAEASIFPPMQERDFEHFRNDIAENGLQEPIVVCQGKILDGRSRHRACVELLREGKLEEKDIKTTEWDGNGSMFQYVISRNLHRKHLNTSQKALAAAMIRPMFEGQAKLNQKQGKGVPELEYHQKGRTTKIAGAMFNIGERIVADACTVLDKGIRELIEAVEQGYIRISPAKDMAQETSEVQKQAFQMVAGWREQDIQEKSRRLIKKYAQEEIEPSKRMADLEKLLDTQASKLRADITDEMKKAFGGKLKKAKGVKNTEKQKQRVQEIQTEIDTRTQEELESRPQKWQEELDELHAVRTDIDCMYSAGLTDYLKRAISEIKTRGMKYVIYVDWREKDEVFQPCLKYSLAQASGITTPLHTVESKDEAIKIAGTDLGEDTSKKLREEIKAFMDSKMKEFEDLAKEKIQQLGTPVQQKPNPEQKSELFKEAMKRVTPHKKK